METWEMQAARDSLQDLQWKAQASAALAGRVAEKNWAGFAV